MDLTLWHFTCEHSRPGIVADGCLIPVAEREEERLARMTANLDPGDAVTALFRVVWMTDLDYPLRDGLGLTSHTIGCDRAHVRFRVTDASAVEPWMTYRRGVPARLRFALERAPGALPRHWYVSESHVPVVQA